MKSIPLILSRLRRAVFLTLALAGSAMAADRETTRLDKWSFAAAAPTETTPALPAASATWQPVTVPHIFRQAGLPDNTAGWYRQELTWTAADQGRRLLLRLEGAATATTVWVNDQQVGQHLSAYTAGVFDLTPALVAGQSNRLIVRVSNHNAETKACFARSDLYFVNGGMFRQAWLIKTGAVHIHPDMGSTGVYLTPGAITADRAELNVRTFVRNPLKTPAVVTLRHHVIDPAGTECATATATATVPADTIIPLEANATLTKPKLWNLRQPNLYTVRTELLADGTPSDDLTERTGLRTLTWTGKQFLLNGKETQFRGVNKHAQNEYDWNAVSDEGLRWEWQMMDELGVNTVRLAHYPHSHFEYDQADERGLAVWAENGFAGTKKHMPEDGVVTLDGERQTREMVRQNWNHPSILFWSCGNETELDTASHYATVLRAEDPAKLRLVTYATNTSNPSNCDFVARNTYAGWYGGVYTGFAGKGNNLVSETGCGGWITHHIPRGAIEWKVDKYEPEEYSEMFTEFRLQTVCRNEVDGRPMFLWWTFREFYDKKFKNNRNTKGLMTLAGMPKDMYYAFQVFLNQTKPVVHLNGRHHVLRRFAPDDGIKAYANVPELELFLNGVSQGRQRNGDYRLPDSTQKQKDGSVKPVVGIPVANVFHWKPTLAAGRNVIEVTDGAGHSDRMIVYQQLGDAPMPVPATALVQDLRSSNPANPAVFLDRPVEAQGPVYTPVDGTADNTFDRLPTVLEGATWIGTGRLSDPAQKTDLSFRINPASTGATVYVLFSTGTYPTITLKTGQPLKKGQTDNLAAATAFKSALTAAGFHPVENTPVVWRDHDLERADAALWSRPASAGAEVKIPGHTLDYAVLLKPAAKP